MSDLLALLASLAWGTSDFLGGTASRRTPVLLVIGASQLVGLALLTTAAVVTGAVHAPPDYLLPAAGAGLSSLVALGTFYRALATGTMGVVAPVASLSALVPLLAGVLRGEAPGSLRLTGAAVAVLGVVLAGGPERTGARLRPLLLALVSAGGFGLVVVLLAQGARTSVLMTLVVMRLVAVLGVALALALTRAAPRPAPGALPQLAAVGILDATAVTAYATASTRHGALLSVVGVLSSLYPVMTVLLARQVHHERLRAVQGAGAALALLGVVLLAV